MNTLLQTVIALMIARREANDRHDALIKIKRRLDSTPSFYPIAREYGVLINGSGEDFAIEYMTAFNAEIYRTF